MLKSREFSAKLMPRDPRSITRETEPAWRERWKARSSWCTCSKTRREIRRIAFCATSANIAAL